MKTLILFLALACAAYGQGTQITVLHSGDSHSHLDAFGPKDCSGKGTVGGFAKAACLIGSVRATEQNVMYLHAGDFMVGDFFFNKYFGVAELQMLQQAGCDVICVGNHELDLGPEVLLEAYNQGFGNGTIPVVSANLDLSGFPQLQQYIAPYTIKTIDGIDVGIFGMTIPDPLNNPDPIIVNENIPEIAYATVMAMRANGADVVIMLSHLGWGIDSALAANISGIDFICGGHDHSLFGQPRSVTNPLGTQTLVMQAGPNYEFIGKLNFTYLNGSVTFDSYTLLHADASVPAVPEIQAVVDYLKSDIVSTYGNVFGQIVGFAIKDIDHSTFHSFKDSPIGNLVADAERSKTHTEIAITANGMISDKICRGRINGADLFRSLPYGFGTTTGLGFNLVKAKISGAQLVGGIEFALSFLGVSDDFFLQVSGMRFRYDPDNPPGSRVIMNSVKIGGKSLKPNKLYSITVNEGIFGILMSSGIQLQDIEFTGIPDYTALKDHVRRTFFVSSCSEGRIIEQTCGDSGTPDDEEGLTAESVRLGGNYPNPFNPSTLITYSLPQEAKVSLQIFDVSGRLVETLVNTVQPKGEYEVRFNAGSLSSGVYFYRLDAGGYVQTRKMTLVK
jgi:2',3'-cyclic-nucleotide 2'-phosphodiesterase (5'-nucleotidase family)